MESQRSLEKWQIVRGDSVRVGEPQEHLTNELVDRKEEVLEEPYTLVVVDVPYPVVLSDRYRTDPGLTVLQAVHESAWVCAHVSQLRDLSLQGRQIDVRRATEGVRAEADLTVLEFFEWAASLTEAGDAVDQSVHEIHDGYGLAIDQ